MSSFRLPFFQKYPKGVPAIFAAQAFFNFGFFGFKSLFVLSMLERFSFKPTDAFELFSALMALSYATSLLGGFLADKFIGAKNALLTGGVLSSIGIGVFIVPSQDMAFLGIALMSLGSGCFKPTFSTLLAFMFKDPQDPRKDAAFTNLYVAMNIGNLTGPLACSFISHHYDWTTALMTVVLSFIIGLYLFFRFTRHIKINVRPHTLLHPFQVGGILIAAIAVIYHLFKYRIYFHGLMGGIVLISLFCFCALFYKSNKEERVGLYKTLPYIFLFTLFCSLFEQAGSSLMLFFKHFVNRQTLGFTLPPSGLLSFNPVFVLVLGTFLPALSKSYLEKKGPLDGLAKFAIGFFFISLSFGVLALASNQVQGPVALYWMVGGIFLQATGELFIVPVGFANISKLAPPRHLSLMISLWLMAIAYGHYCAGLLARGFLTPIGREASINLSSYHDFFLKLSLLPLSIAVFLMFNVLRKHYKRPKDRIA